MWLNVSYDIILYDASLNLAKRGIDQSRLTTHKMQQNNVAVLFQKPDQYLLRIPLINPASKNLGLPKLSF